MNEVANMADSLDFSYSYSCRNTATLPSPILSVDIYKSTVIIYGPYRSRSRSRSRALINFSTHTHTRDGMYRMSRLWPARVSSAHQLGHLISASRPSSKLNWDIYNMQSSAVKNEMLQKIQMEIGMINSGRRRPTVVMTARETVKVARKVPPDWGRKLLPQVEGEAVKTSRLKLRRVEWAAACLMAF